MHIPKCGIVSFNIEEKEWKRRYIDRVRAFKLYEWMINDKILVVVNQIKKCALAVWGEKKKSQRLSHFKQRLSFLQDTKVHTYSLAKCKQRTNRHSHTHTHKCRQLATKPDGRTHEWNVKLTDRWTNKYLFKKKQNKNKILIL